MMRRGFETIHIVLLVLILVTTFYMVATQLFPKYKFLVDVVTSKTAQNLQLAVRECQTFHEQLDFLENMVDQTGARASISAAGLNGGDATVSCCSKDAPGCTGHYSTLAADSTPADCIKKCAAILRLHSACAKYYPPDADCYKDDITRLEVEGGVEAAVAIPTTTAPVMPTATVLPTTTTTPSSTFDFSLSVSPSSDSQKQNGYSTAQISVGLVSGAPEKVRFVLPFIASSAIGESVDKTDVYPPFTATLGSYSLSGTPVGTYEATITATGGGKTHTAKYYLTVTPGP